MTHSMLLRLHMRYLLRKYTSHTYIIFFSFGFRICHELLLCITLSKAGRRRGRERKSDIESKSRVGIQLLVVNCDNAKDVFYIVVSDKWISRFYFYSCFFVVVIVGGGGAAAAAFLRVRLMLWCSFGVCVSFSFFSHLEQTHNFIFKSWRSVWASDRPTHWANEMKNFYMWIIFIKVSRSNCREYFAILSLEYIYLVAVASSIAIAVRYSIPMRYCGAHSNRIYTISILQWKPKQKWTIFQMQYRVPFTRYSFFSFSLSISLSLSLSLPLPHTKR